MNGKRTWKKKAVADTQPAKLWTDVYEDSFTKRFLQYMNYQSLENHEQIHPTMAFAG